MTIGLLNQACIAQAIQDMTAAEKTAVCSSLNCTPAALSQTPPSGTVLPTAAPASGASPFFILTPANTLYFWNGTAYATAGSGSSAPTGAQIYAALIAAPVTTNYELSYSRIGAANGTSASAGTIGAQFSGASFTMTPGLARAVANRACNAIITVGLSTQGGPTTSAVDSATISIKVNGNQLAASSEIIWASIANASTNQVASFVANLASGDVISADIGLGGNQAIVNIAGDSSSFFTIQPILG